MMANTGHLLPRAVAALAAALAFTGRAESVTQTFALQEIFGRGARETEVIGGRGTAHFAEGALTVTVPEKLDFVWVKIR